jgi:membrane protein
VNEIPPSGMLDHSPRPSDRTPTENKLRPWSRKSTAEPRDATKKRREAKREKPHGIAGQFREVIELGGLTVTELARRVIHEIQDDNCLGQAAQLAYYFLFALFPFFLFLTALLAYLPIPNLMDQMMDLLARVLPGEALQLVRDNISSLVSNQHGGLLSFGILAALWASSSAITAIADALNRAYDVDEGRLWWKVRGTAILLTIGFSLFIIAAIFLLMFGPHLGSWIANAVGLGNAFEVAWNVLRWPVIVVLMMVALAILYYFAPDVEQEWKWITLGAVFAVVAWILTSLGFSYYVNNFGSYNKTYGSIGAVIVLLTWLYLTGLFIIVGGEINAEIEHAAPSGKAPGEKTKA